MEPDSGMRTRDLLLKANGLRLKDGTPYLKYEQGPNSVAMATLEVTSDFKQTW